MPTPRRRRARSEGPSGTARDRALGLLAVRWRSRAELERRLRVAGFDPDEVSTTLDDLQRVGLVDDERFAAELVRDQANRRLAGGRAIAAALREKGVDPAVAAAAMEPHAEDEVQRAVELARRRAARMGGQQPDLARRRLYGLLLRRGYGPATAAAAVRAALEELSAGVDGEPRQRVANPPPRP